MRSFFRFEFSCFVLDTFISELTPFFPLGPDPALWLLKKGALPLLKLLFLVVLAICRLGLPRNLEMGLFLGDKKL